MTGPNPAATPDRACPFCGLPVVVPHETQAGCIEALHAEIARTRDILEHSEPVGRARQASEEDLPC
jgi:hypothetical protein